MSGRQVHVEQAVALVQSPWPNKTRDESIFAVIRHISRLDHKVPHSQALYLHCLLDPIVFLFLGGRTKNIQTANWVRW